MKTLKQNNLSGGTSDIGFIRILNENNSKVINQNKLYLYSRRNHSKRII